jgi:hypothetical protein
MFGKNEVKQKTKHVSRPCISTSVSTLYPISSQASVQSYQLHRHVCFQHHHADSHQSNTLDHRIPRRRLIEYNLLGLDSSRTSGTHPRHLPLLAQLCGNPTRMFRPCKRRRRLRRCLLLFLFLRNRSRSRCTPPSGITNIRSTGTGWFLAAPPRQVVSFRVGCRSAHLGCEEFGVAGGRGFGVLDVVCALAVFLFPDSGGRWGIRSAGCERWGKQGVDWEVLGHSLPSFSLSSSVLPHTLNQSTLAGLLVPPIILIRIRIVRAHCETGSECRKE